MFLPKFDVIRQLLESGVLGEIRTVIADHGEYFTADHRIMRRDLAGGPLLDLGTYPISFAAWILGEPATVLAAGQPHPAGVNGQVSAVLSDAAGNQAVLNTTIFSTTPTTGVIAGTAATLTIPGPFYQPGDMTLTSATGEVLTYSEPAIGHDGAPLRGGRGRALHRRRAARVPAAAAGRLDRHHAGGRRDPPAARGSCSTRSSGGPRRCWRLTLPCNRSTARAEYRASATIRILCPTEYLRVERNTLNFTALHLADVA